MAKKTQNKKKKSSSPKRNMGRIGQYLVAKNGKTKYIKLSTHDKSTKAEKALVKKLIAVLGTDVLFVNLFDADFKEKYDIPDFNKGNISVDLDAKDVDSDDEDDEDSDDEDEDSDDEDEDDEDDEDDEESEDDEDDF